MTTNETPTPRTDQYVAEHYNVRIFDAQHCFDFARELERELAALAKAADKLEEDKEYNARLCESLSAELEQERQLADRLGRTLRVYRGDVLHLGHFMPEPADRMAAEALADWRKSRNEAGETNDPQDQ